MSSLLHNLTVLLAVVASGYALSCTHCVSTSESCTGPSLTCPADSLCGATLTETGAHGTVKKSYVMSCLPRDKCGLSGSATIPFGVKMKMVASCCSTDYCTPNLPSLPKDSSVSNGLTCRSCISADSSWCYTSDTMQCTGDENMCLLQSTKMSGVMSMSTAFRGCATKSFCNFGRQSYSAQGISIESKFTCTSGSSGLRKGFFLPAVICFFFLKLLI